MTMIYNDSDILQDLPDSATLTRCVEDSGWYLTTDGGFAHVAVYQIEPTGAWTNRITGYLPPGKFEFLE